MLRYGHTYFHGEKETIVNNPTRPALLAMLATALAAPAALAAIPQYSLNLLGTLGGPYSAATDLNDLGQVVGAATFDDGEYSRAFLYTGAAMRDLGTLPGGLFSAATAINNAGLVVGTSNTGQIEPPGRYPFLYSGGLMSNLGDATGSGFFSSATGVNNAGQVIGNFSYRESYPFLYSNGSTRQLSLFGGNFSYANAINDAGQIVGRASYFMNAGEGPFLYQNGVATDLGGVLQAQDANLTGINDAGAIVGYNQEYAFIYANGVKTVLGDGQPTDVNNLGQVVGVAGGHGFLYSDGQRRDLNSLISGAAGWILTDASAINDLGQIAGTACNGAGLCQAVRLDIAAAVPEPATWLMLLAGLGVLGWQAGRHGRGPSGPRGLAFGTTLTGC